jgi:hypothetical protein
LTARPENGVGDIYLLKELKTQIGATTASPAKVARMKLRDAARGVR